MQSLETVKQEIALMLDLENYEISPFVVLNIRNSAGHLFSGYEKFINILIKNGYKGNLIKFNSPENYLILSNYIPKSSFEIKNKKISMYMPPHILKQTQIVNYIHPTLNQENVNKLIFNMDLSIPPESLFIHRYEQITDEEFFDLRGFKNSNLAMKYGRPNTFYRILG